MQGKALNAFLSSDKFNFTQSEKRILSLLLPQESKTQAAAAGAMGRVRREANPVATYLKLTPDSTPDRVALVRIMLHVAASCLGAASVGNWPIVDADANADADAPAADAAAPDAGGVAAAAAPDAAADAAPAGGADDAADDAAPANAPRSQGTLLSVLSSLLQNPDRCQDTFLPCMAEDVRAMAVAALGGRWYKCPNGHAYYVDACGRPMEVSKW